MKPETAKRTALEWLEYEFVKLESTVGVHSSMYHLIEKAKEMEKEQMDKVAGDWWNEGASYMYDGKRKYESFEDYYNETFNTNEK